MANGSPNQPDQSNGRRDLFLSYNSRDREVVMRLHELLRQRGVKTFLDRNDLSPGMPWQNELEQAISRARAVAVLIGGGGIGAWQRPEKELALDRQVQEERAGRRFPVIPVLLPNAEADKVTGFLTRNTWIDLRGGLDNPMAAAALDALSRAVTGEPPAASAPSPEPLCPYRGLEPFHEDDAPLFFGRDKFADDLLQKVLANPLVAVVGPSGSGKSSVVLAGLLPRLRREGWPNKTWEAVIFTPRERPFHSLAKELLPLIEPAKSKVDQMIEARKLGDALAGNMPLDDPIANALKMAKPANRLLVVVDQFEELFTLSEERFREPFIESLIDTANRDDSPVTIVLTLRADFYGQAIGLSRALSDSIQRGLVNLGPMTGDELRQAIEKPAKFVGLNFEPGLVARLLHDVAGRPGDLPLLEFALKELWQRRRDVVITNEQYDAIGALEGAISNRADAQFERVAPAERDVVLRAFTRLARVSAANEEGADTRQRVRLKEFDASIRSIMKSFVKERLLVMSRDEETNDEIVEVAHEALIRRWGKLKELLNNDRHFLLWRQRLGLMLTEWHRTERDDGALLRGVPLNESRRWRKERGQDLNQREQEFIARSESAERHPKYWIAAAAAVVALIALTAFGWKLWDNRPLSQINKILDQSPGVIKTAAAGDHLEFSIAIPDWLSTLVLTGRSNEALEAARKIEDPIDRTRALASVVEALAKAGKSDEMKQAANEALDAAGKIGSPDYRSWALTSVVEALAKAGKTGEALEVTRKMIKLGHRTQALASVVDALAKAGKSDEMKQAANEALDAAPKIEDTNLRSQALASVVEALAKAGESEEALDVARQIDAVDSRFRALASIVEALAKAGKSDEMKQAANEALDAARKIEYPSGRSEALVRVAGALAKAGKSEEALEAARKIEDAATQSRALASVVEALAKAGKSDEVKQAANEALDAARKIEDPIDRTWSLASVVEAFAKVGRAEEALVAAREIEDAAGRSRALVSVVEMLAKTRETVDRARNAIEEAQQAAALITKEYDKSRAFASVATGLAKLHLYRQARELVDLNNTSATDKLIAYRVILREYHIERHPDQAKLFEKEEKED